MATTNHVPDVTYISRVSGSQCTRTGRVHRDLFGTITRNAAYSRLQHVLKFCVLVFHCLFLNLKCFSTTSALFEKSVKTPILNKFTICDKLYHFNLCIFMALEDTRRLTSIVHIKSLPFMCFSFVFVI